MGLSCMIEPVKEDTNAFLVKNFQFDGIHYMAEHTEHLFLN